MCIIYYIRIYWRQIMKSLICAAILSLFFVGLSNGDEPSSRNPFGKGVGKQQWQKPKPQPAQTTVLGLQSYRQNRPTRTNYNYTTQPRVIYQYNYRPNFYQYNYYNSYYYQSRANFYYQQRARGNGFGGFLLNIRL